MAARAYWSGQIRLALVSIPVQLFSATKTAARISFNQIHKETGKRIRYDKVVPGVGSVEPDQIIKGYEIAPASILSPFVYASIVWTTALGFFVFGDFPDGWAWLGTAIVIASGLYIFRRETRRAG